MISLEDVRARSRLITTEFVPGVEGFLTVSDWSSAQAAIEDGDATPPALYVSLARETPDANRTATGPRAQRVRSVISLLFCLPAERADDERADPIEIARGSIIANTLGFKPAGALAGLSYAGYALRAEGQGLIWGEVLFAGSWDLRGPA